MRAMDANWVLLPIALPSTLHTHAMRVHQAFTDVYHSTPEFLIRGSDPLTYMPSQLKN